MKAFPRKITVPFHKTKRVVDRLKLQCELNGMFYGPYNGYKMQTGKNTIFVFTQVNWYCPTCEKYVEPINVTFQETHVACGQPVV